MSSSGTSTPLGFTPQAASAEEILKSQTVGLVHLDEFRKRRRDVQDLKTGDSPGEGDGSLTSRSDDKDVTTTPGVTGFVKKKKRKIAGKSLLSFGDQEHDDLADGSLPKNELKPAKVSNGGEPEHNVGMNGAELIKRKLTSNPNSKVPAPKALTKASLAAEATEKERLRKEFLELQEEVRNSEIAIPFVFYDGSNLPGGLVKVKKGDHVWLFLERCRKVGAEMGVSSAGSTEGGGTKPRAEGKKSWARIGVDDLMLIRGGVIIPHHYEFYYFIANQTKDPAEQDRLLFDYFGTTRKKSNAVEEAVLLRIPGKEKVEGQDDDPTYTKVVDRRWYEKNKHIYPATLWKEYKTGKEFEDLAKGRRDTQGNAFFFS